ncbi:glutamine amidotransferase of anthranilate synthase [Chryseobacterium sp. StRB126]|uniref:anthranilate synthase component II n=1 Tax=Chryseobacterium TaxID=59732 RepID=UPI0004E99EFD|nr:MULTISPECIES: aminodeoxychorismate/anthranilate synthase component II [Chryseobacterium]MBP2619520.1 anthranilate synthase component 2 [Chryseobacterium jejuense]BAP30975.1 glutamine amidotransferase of anthranilate synthase [Chryseobacterium sp. StRB126]
MKKILLVDNYDSFTYNLKQLISECGDYKIDVYRNDAFQLELAQDYNAIVLSPGPGIPQDAGLCIPLIETYKHSKKILGICLGHQAIGVAFGAHLINTSQVYHGVSSIISLNKNEKIYTELPDHIEVARYHSWVVENCNLPQNLVITSTDDQDTIMSLRHEKYDITGLQYHPESFLTPKGKNIMQNWLKS